MSNADRVYDALQFGQDYTRDDIGRLLQGSGLSGSEIDDAINSLVIGRRLSRERRGLLGVKYVKRSPGY